MQKIGPFWTRALLPISVVKGLLAGSGPNTKEIGLFATSSSVTLESAILSDGK
jgi:hypothetical protein